MMSKGSVSLGTSRNPRAPSPGVPLIKTPVVGFALQPSANELGRALMIKLALPLRSPGNKKKSSQDGQVSELTPHCHHSLAFNCSPGLAFIPPGLRR